MNSNRSRCSVLLGCVFYLTAGLASAQGPAEPDAADQGTLDRAGSVGAPAEVTPAVEPADSLGERGELRFNFSGTNWQAVLEWFADQADLALQVDEPPLGSFTFADPTRSYSVSEALDVINLSLMKRGYSLVRRGRMLQVIDLELENADKLISEIAELVRPEQLEERGKSDIVSCVLPLGSMTPDAAKEELALMIGPWGRVVVLDSARQVKVTETASKLIAIRDLLRSASMADTDVIEIVLKNRSARGIVGARPSAARFGAWRKCRRRHSHLGRTLWRSDLRGRTSGEDRPVVIDHSKSGSTLGGTRYRRRSGDGHAGVSHACREQRR